MENFVYCNPTKILFGRGVELKIADEIKAAGHKKVMIVYGQGSIVRSGLYDQVVRTLIKQDILFTDFGGVKPNPVLSHLREGISWAKSHGVQAVLAIGGGSVLDEAKAIAAGACSDEDIWDFFEGRAQIKKALPVFCILTLAATGSEMNQNSVITNELEKKKFSIASPHLYPKVSALNPELTFSVDAKNSACAAADIIAHLLEGYLTKENSVRLNDRIVESVIRTVMNDMQKILLNPEDYEARASMMWSATLALNGLTTCGLKNYSFPNHLIEHSLSAIYDVPHGEGLAIVIPAWLRRYGKDNPKPIERFGKKIFKTHDVESTAAALEAWFVKIGLKTRLSQIGVKPKELDYIADNIGMLAVLWRGMDKFYNKKNLTEILNLAL